MTVMISRNTTIPTQKKEIYSTAADSQTSVEIHVLQGERAEARYNRTLGRFHLEGLPPAPRGVPKVEVTFDIDANGILSVAAKDMATGKDQRITITASSGLSSNDVDRMVKDASEHEAEDRRRREEVERRNKLDNLCYTLERQISENKANLPELTWLESSRSSKRGAKRSKSKTIPKFRTCWNVSRKPPTKWRPSFTSRPVVRRSRAEPGEFGQQGRKQG